MSKKKIVGYRFKSEALNKAANELTGCDTHNNKWTYASNIAYAFQPDSIICNALFNKGLLGVFCDPVYNVDFNFSSTPAYSLRDVENEPKVVVSNEYPHLNIEVDFSNVMSADALIDSYSEAAKEKEPKVLDKHTWYYSTRNHKTLIFHVANNAGFGISSTGNWFKRTLLYVGEGQTLVKVNPSIIPEALREVVKKYAGIETGMYVKAIGARGGKIKSMTYDHNDHTLYGRVSMGTKDSPKTLPVKLFNRNGDFAEVIDVQEYHWYINEDTKEIFFHEHDGYGYGINKFGEWFVANKPFTKLFKKFEQWTSQNSAQELIKDVLYKYAIENGYADGNTDDVLITLQPVNIRIQRKSGNPITIMNNGDWKKAIFKPELPEINGMNGNMVGEDIKYGQCGILRPEWFLSSTTRNVKSLTLSSGVTINEDQINQIREYLRNHEPYMSQLNVAIKMGMKVSLDDKTHN